MAIKKHHHLLKSFSLVLILLLFFVPVLIFNPLFAKGERVTLIFASHPLWITTYLTDEQAVNLLRVPADVYMKVPGNYGSYRVGALWRLGEIEKKDGQILAATFSEFFAAPISTWIGFDSDVNIHESGKDVIKRLSAKISPWEIIKGKVKSNLSISELFFLWWKLSRLSLNDISVVDLSTTQNFHSETLADGSRIWVGNADLVDKFSQRLFWEPSLRQEQLMFRIYNSSNTEGRAETAARLLANIGLHVVGVANSETIFGCLLEIPNKSKTKSINRVAEIFNCQIKENETLTNEAYLFLGK